MPATRKDIKWEAGSYEPLYWEFRDPVTKVLLDLTTGYTTSGIVATRDDGLGTPLLVLGDSGFRRTNNGRVYFEPSSALTAAWTFTFGYYQFELRHPGGQDVRFGDGKFIVSPEL